MLNQINFLTKVTSPVRQDGLRRTDLAGERTTSDGNMPNDIVGSVTALTPRANYNNSGSVPAAGNSALAAAGNTARAGAFDDDDRATYLARSRDIAFARDTLYILERTCADDLAAANAARAADAAGNPARSELAHKAFALSMDLLDVISSAVRAAEVARNAGDSDLANNIDAGINAAFAFTRYGFRCY